MHSEVSLLTKWNVDNLIQLADFWPCVHRTGLQCRLALCFLHYAHTRTQHRTRPLAHLRHYGTTRCGVWYWHGSTIQFLYARDFAPYLTWKHLAGSICIAATPSQLEHTPAGSQTHPPARKRTHQLAHATAISHTHTAPQPSRSHFAPRPRAKSNVLCRPFLSLHARSM